MLTSREVRALASGYPGMRHAIEHQDLDCTRCSCGFESTGKRVNEHLDRHLWRAEGLRKVPTSALIRAVVIGDAWSEESLKTISIRLLTLWRGTLVAGESLDDLVTAVCDEIDMRLPTLE